MNENTTKMEELASNPAEGVMVGKDGARYWYRDIRPMTTIRDLLDGSVEAYGERPAFWVKKERGGEYLPISYELLARDVAALGTAFLKEQGEERRRIAVMGEGSYEWIASYLAVVNSGMIVVPLDKELTGPEIENLLRTAECDTLVCSSECAHKLEGVEGIHSLILTEFYGDRVSAEEEPVSGLEDLSSYEAEGRTVTTWRAVLAEGEKLLAEGDLTFADIEIDPNAMTVILFTSGTTGNPKGVMLSHYNITSNIMDVCRVANIHVTDKTLSILPIHHTYECTLGMLLVLYRGASTAFSEGMKYIVKNMKEAQNTVIIGVPRILEMIHDRIMKTIQKAGREKTFRRAVKASRAVKTIGINVSRTIFKQIITELGGKLRLVITGAAALQPEIVRDFEDFGIEVLQGYGMTECTPLITGTPGSAKKERYKKAGSVGFVVDSGAIKIEQPDENGIGEILFRGPNVMLGYYNMPEETAKSIDNEGWLHTGDLGYFDEDGWLYLTGRSKNVIVNSTGENVYPEEIEDLLNCHPMIAESMVFGSGAKQDTVAVQILPAAENLREKEGDLSEEEKIAYYKKLVTEFNMQMPPFKRIREVYVREEDFVRTTTLKIRRKDNIPVISGGLAESPVRKNR